MNDLNKIINDNSWTSDRWLTLKLKEGHRDEEKWMTDLIAKHNLENYLKFDSVNMSVSIRIDKYSLIQRLVRSAINLPKLSRQQLEDAVGL
jgi:hypothetical protein